MFDSGVLNTVLGYVSDVVDGTCKKFHRNIVICSVDYGNKI